MTAPIASAYPCALLMASMPSTPHGFVKPAEKEHLRVPQARADYATYRQASHLKDAERRLGARADSRVRWLVPPRFGDSVCVLTPIATSGRACGSSERGTNRAALDGHADPRSPGISQSCWWPTRAWQPPLLAVCHARAVMGAGYEVSYGSAARALTNAGALGVPQPVVAS